MTYTDEDRYDDARRDALDDARNDAANDAYYEMLREAGPCGGSGYVTTPCSQRHSYNCGGPDCDGGDELECPGCEDCEPQDGPADDEWIANAYERQVPLRQESYYDGGRLRHN
jgi:hypothetical protein